MSYARMTEQAVNRTSGRGDFFIPAEKTTQTSGTLTERLPHAVAGRRQSRAVSSEEDVPRQEVECSIRNYTRTANMLVDGYSELLPQEKWLYVCLVRLCGKEGSRFLSLRYIAERTGFSLGALSGSKKGGR